MGNVAFPALNRRRISATSFSFIACYPLPVCNLIVSKGLSEAQQALQQAAAKASDLPRMSCSLNSR